MKQVKSSQKAAHNAVNKRSPTTESVWKKATSEAPEQHRSHYQQMEKTWNSGELSQEGPAYYD